MHLHLNCAYIYAIVQRNIFDTTYFLIPLQFQFYKGTSYFSCLLKGGFLYDSIY